MGQGDVLKILEKENKWMSAKEIAKMIGISSNNTRRHLKKMLKFNEILMKTVKRNSNLIWLWHSL